MDQQSTQELHQLFRENLDDIEALHFSIQRLSSMLTGLLRTNSEIQAILMARQGGGSGGSRHGRRRRRPNLWSSPEELSSAVDPSLTTSTTTTTSAATGPVSTWQGLLWGQDLSLHPFNHVVQLVQSLGDPVVVPLTEADIEAATRTVHYADIVSPRNTSCPINMEPFQDTDVVMVIRGCGHIFNRDALMNWFRGNHHSCPMCRQDIRQAATRT